MLQSGDESCTDFRFRFARRDVVRKVLEGDPLEKPLIAVACRIELDDSEAKGYFAAQAGVQCVLAVFPHDRANSHRCRIDAGVAEVLSPVSRRLPESPPEALPVRRESRPFRC